MSKNKKKTNKSGEIKQAIRKTFLSEEEEYQNTLKEYKSKYLPKEYNQLELLDQLTNNDIDWYISVTSRGDGKSFNYIGAMAYLCYYLEFGCTLLVRHWTLQEKAKTLVQDIIATIKMFSLDDLTYKNDTDYIIIYIKNKPVFFITDLNRASDLKQASHLLKEFPIILYDEFLTLSSDYVANEYEKLKIIYQSIDRKANRKYIDHPKIILLGNPVNFDSPVLPALKIYNAMQNQEINTIKQHKNILLELRRNDNRNAIKNSRVFPIENDENYLGQFQFSNYLLASEKDYTSNLRGARIATIKIDDNLMMKIVDNQFNTILSIEQSDNNENYCIHLNDVTEKRLLIKDNYYKERFIKKYKKDMFLYKDAFSKQYIASHEDLQMIDFYKCLPSDTNVTTEEIYKTVEHNNILDMLAKKYE